FPLISLDSLALRYVDSGQYFKIEVNVYCDTLDKNTENNSSFVEVGIPANIDLRIDSVSLLPAGKLASHDGYLQGDTVFVLLRVSNYRGIDSAKMVEVKIDDYRGFIPLKVCDTMTFVDTGLSTGFRYDTLALIAVDTAIANSIRLRLTATNGVDTVVVGAAPPFGPVAHSQTELFTVAKGADPKVWVEELNHPVKYQLSYSYTVALTNLEQYRTDTVRLAHVPSASLDSVLYRKGNEAAKRWTASSYFVDTLQPLAADTARFTFYVTTAFTELDRFDNIAGSIACGNDRNPQNNDFERDELVSRNPYNIAVSIAAYQLAQNAQGQDTVHGMDRTITYRIVVSNIGDSTAYNVLLTDTAPLEAGQPMLQFERHGTDYFYNVSVAKHYAEDIGIASRYLRFTIDSLLAGDSAIVFLDARKLGKAGPVVNRVRVGVDPFSSHFHYPSNISFDEQKLADNLASTQVKVYSLANIELSIGATPDTAAQGDTVTFTIAAINHSLVETLEGLHVVIPSDIYNPVNRIMCGGRLRLLDYVDGPGNNSVFTPTEGYWAVTLNTNTILTLQLRAIVLDSLPRNLGEIDSATFSMSATPILNEYYIGIAANDSSTVYITYTDFDVSVTNAVFVRRGEPIASVADERPYNNESFGYKITVLSKRGAADSVRLVLELPAGIMASDVDAYPEPSSTSGNIIIWDNLVGIYGLPVLEVGDNAMREVVVTLQQQPVGSYTATAKVSAGKKESSLSNNSASATATVLSPYSLNITLAATPDFLLLGDETELTIVVENRSVIAVSDISLRTAALPQWLSFVGSADGVRRNERGELTWQYPDGLPALQPNDSVTLTIRLRATAGNETGLWAIRAYLQNETILADTKTLLVVVRDNPLKLQTTLSPNLHYTSDIIAYPDFSYTITLYNASNETFHDLNVVATLPAGITTADALQYPVSSLASGGLVTFTLTCTFDPLATAGLYVHSATATLADYNGRSLTARDSATLDLRNDVNLVATLELRSTSNYVYPPDYEFRQGETVRAYLRLENNGRICPNTDSVHMDCDLPPQLTFVSGVNIAALDSLYLPCHSVQTFFATLRAEQQGLFTLSATASTTFNGAPVLASAEVSGRVAVGADIQVEILPDVPTNEYDLLRRYTVRATNIGYWPADSLLLTHSLPPALEIIRYDSTTVTHDGDGNFSCAATTVADGASVEFWVLVQLREKPDGRLVETQLDAVATVKDDYKWSNNVALTKTLLFYPDPCNMILTVSPQDTILHNVEGVLSERSVVVYSIALRNAGSKPADKVMLRVSLSSQLRLESGAQDSLLLPSAYMTMGDEHTFTLAVRPQSNSSNGIQRTFALASIDDKVYHQMQRDTLRDTTKIALFSALDSWSIMAAFSPNGDGKNDKFYIRDLSETGFVQSAEIVIVNRMGSEVYRHRDYKAVQEDESQAFTAKGLPEGTYFYRLIVHFNDGSPNATRGGFITVRRSRWE
ncbi:MAG: DUF11 domain-containing protein, partial [Prevotellaceae bacterium]|nr:DUF11 domain-containing protein [Prevotellaceae bacterium]